VGSPVKLSGETVKSAGNISLHEGRDVLRRARGWQDKDGGGFSGKKTVGKKRKTLGEVKVGPASNEKEKIAVRKRSPMGPPLFTVEGRRVILRFKKPALNREDKSPERLRETAFSYR